MIRGNPDELCLPADPMRIPPALDEDLVIDRVQKPVWREDALLGPIDYNPLLRKRKIVRLKIGI